MKRLARIGNLARRRQPKVWHMIPTQAQRDFVVKQIEAALKKCQLKGISPDIAAQTLLSVTVTMVLHSQGTEGAAGMLESIAAAVRRGDMTSPEH